MHGHRRVSFAIHPFEGTIAVAPVVDGVPLADLAAEFERAQGFEPAGGYGELFPERFQYGRFDQYFLGQYLTGGYFERMRAAYLLGCQCGEAGCWPLVARISSDLQSVVWDHFRQPHRPKRDYSQFGPFVFDLDQYSQAVTQLHLDLCARGLEFE